MAFMIQTWNLKFQAHICLVTNLVLKLWVELYDFYQFIICHVKIALSVCKSLDISAKMLMWLFSLFSTCHVTWMISFYRLWDWTFFGSALLWAILHCKHVFCWFINHFLHKQGPFSPLLFAFFCLFFFSSHIKFSCQENPDYKKIVLNLFLWNT